jgi:hypothetical protein
MLRSTIQLASRGYPPSQDTAFLVQVYPKKGYRRKCLRNKTSPLLHRSLVDEVEETTVMMTENSTTAHDAVHGAVHDAFMTLPP